MGRSYESILEKHSSTLEEQEDCINEFGQLFYEIEKFEDKTIINVFCFNENECQDFVASLDYLKELKQEYKNSIPALAKLNLKNL